MFGNDENLFNVLFEAASEGIIVVDENHTMIAANEATAKIFGYKIEELRGKPLGLLIPFSQRQAHSHDVEKFMKEGEKRRMGHGRDVFGLRKDGSEFPVEAGLNPFTWEGKKYVMSLIIDISVRRENQRKIEELNRTLEEKIKIRTQELEENLAKLQEANQRLEKEITRRKNAENKMRDALQQEKELSDLKSKFLSLVSHEFKTPLSGILTSVTLAGKYKLEEHQDKREKHFNTIRNKVHYLNNILDDFLSIERVESGKVKYKTTSFSLEKLVNEVVYNDNVTLKDGQELEYPKNIAEIDLLQDEKILELALSNLLNNAIKYSSENSKITFDIELKGKKIRFLVGDQGIGIPEKDQKHIFELYFRAENALLIQGTGIGLSITKTHIENLGGTISFRKNEPRGAVFIVELPIEKK
jgi:PAS domain S-box-containing protein